jgi:2',3'-cyclic-nucleotide 2'-phosphodiesterase (5'-nucleotidase family)
LARLIAEARASRPGAVLVADSGDTLHGTHPAVATQGRALVPILNCLGLAALTPHWEFAYGPAVLQQRAAELNFPVLAANVYALSGGERPYAPWHVVEVAGLRLGIIGLASNIVDKTMPPHFSAGLRFTSGRDELPGLVERLRASEHVDLVLLLSHLGFPQDMQILAEVPGIDVALSGHTHNRLFAPVRQGSAIIIQSGSHGSFLGRLDLTVESGRVTDSQHQLIEVSESLEPDPEVQALVEAAQAPFAAELREVVGQAATPFDRGTSLEATLDNLLLAAIAEAVELPLAFSNGWRYGAPIVPGPITMGELFQVIPSNPPVSTVELAGAEIRAMLEDNLEHTFSRDPLGQLGGYMKRCLGLRATLRVENPPGHRIQQLFVGARPLEDDQLYRAAFVTEQGVPARFGRRREAHDIRAVEALRRYVARHSPIRAEWWHTFRLV